VLDLVSSDQSLDEAQNQLSALGEAGWEVVSLVPKMGKGESWCFALLKREVRAGVAAISRPTHSKAVSESKSNWPTIWPSRRATLWSRALTSRARGTSI